MSRTQPVAREYLRVSKDVAGASRSTEQQHDENVRAADEHGLHLADPYADLGSASRYAQRRRGGFAELMTDLDDGTFGADVLILWEPSRGSRDVGEWVSLLKLLADRHVQLHITSHGRTYDPENHRDWRTLVEDATDSEYESRKTSARLRRDMAANAEAGRPHGRAVLGYRRVYDPETGRLLGQEPDPTMAPYIRDMFARLRRGESIKTVMRYWENEGVRNGAGNPFDHTYITRLARNPQYTAYRIHEPGRRGGRLPSGEARLIEAAWEPIVSRETWHAVQKILNEPGRRSNRQGRAVHWLTGTAVCDVCGGPSAAKRIRGTWHYSCKERSCVAVRRDPVDGLVEALLVGYLEREDISTDAAERERDHAELQAVRDQIATLVARKSETEDAIYEGHLDHATGGRLLKRYDADIEKSKAQERALTTPTGLDGLIEPGPGAAERWQAVAEDDEGGLDRRRAIARVLLVPEILGQVRLRRSAYMGEPAEDRVILKRVTPAR